MRVKSGEDIEGTDDDIEEKEKRPMVTLRRSE
jgi:hypothetical protein